MLIIAKNVSFTYSADAEVFSDFSVELSGKFHGLIGVNGAGKSTFVKLCLGMIRADRGFIEVNGIDILQDRIGVLRQVGVLFENPQFPSWAKVKDYLVWVGVIRGLDRDKSRGQAEYLLDRLGLVDRRREAVKNLSAGLRQRFGLAQAIIGVPKVVILDEPTANLDVQSRHLVLEFLKELSDTYNVQIIILSHILDDLERFCDRVHILHKGVIKWADSISNLVRSGKHRTFVLRDFSSELPDGVEILRESDYEKVVRVEDPKVLEDLKGVLIPYRSLLEEKFIEVTEGM